MKRIWLVLLLLLIPIAALAENEITLDENKVLYGMERSWAQGYAPNISDGAVNIHLPLASEAARGKLKATLVMDDPAVTPFRSQDMFVSFSRNDDRVYPIKFRLRLLTDYQNGDYPCHIHVEGKDGDGDPLSMDMPLLLRVRGGKDGYAELRPVIGEVAATLQAGESSTMSVRVTNPYPNIEMRDMLLSVTEDGGRDKAEVMCEASEVIPVGTLAPGMSAEVEVPLKTLPTASVGPHTLKFSLTFTALEAKRTWEQSFNLPVTQEMRLEQGGVQMASSVIQGDTASLTLPLMNMGRGELRNVYASLTLPGIVERQSVLVGAIPSGETKQAKISWSVAKDAEIGDHTGALRVSGEDEWGNATSFELPLSLTVEERIAAPEADAKSAALSAVRDDRLTRALAISCALLLTALIAQNALLRRKIRRAEEGRL